MNDNEAEIRAVRAQQLLDDDVLQQALDAVEKFAVANCLRAEAFDTAAVTSAICHLQEAYRVRYQIIEFITTGKLQGKKPVQVA